MRNKSLVIEIRKVDSVFTKAIDEMSDLVNRVCSNCSV